FCAAVALIAAVPFFCSARFQLRIGATLAAWTICGWAALAVARRWRLAVVGMQLMSFLAAALGVVEIWLVTRGGPGWLRNDWFQLLFSSDHLLAQLSVVAVLSIVWIAARRLS